MELRDFVLDPIEARALSSPPVAIFDALAALAATQGDLAAILARDRHPLTYADLHRQVLETRDTLASHGIGRGDRVVAAVESGAAAATLYFAVASCATYAPVNPAYTEDEHARYLQALRPKVVIVPADGGAAMRRAAGRLSIPALDLVETRHDRAGMFELRGARASARVEPEWASPDDVALILLTSGTTARPKMVPMRHRHLTSMAQTSAALLALGPRDRYLHVSAMFHGHGLKSGLTLPVLSGCGVFCAPFVDVASFFGDLAFSQATWYSAGYTAQHAIFDRIDEFRDAAGNARLRFIVTGMGRIDRKVVAGLEAAFGAPLLSRYSMSETCMLACEAPSPHIRKPGTVGRPVGNEIRIVDTNGTTLRSGEEGEIVARGPSVFDGYLDDPDLNARSFIDGWFRTGDLGRIDRDGYLTITGRIKELINRGGEKIAPTEVEHAIAEHDGVAGVCVFGVAHPTLGEDVAAAVVPASGAVLSERALVEFARQRVAAFKVPRHILFATALPMGATGKTDRKALAALFAASQPPPANDAREVASGAAGAIEAGIAALWCDALKQDYARRDVDFFAAGGDSLRIAELLAAIGERFGVRASLRDVVDEGATIASLTRLVVRLRGESWNGRHLADGLVPLKADGDRAPLFAIPGTDGRSGSYVHFCRLLDSRQPLYAIDSRGLDGMSPPLDRMEAIAADNIERMRTLQPAGPYYLMGACYGARVAYEMARQLDAAGERVAFLALLDPSPPFTDSRGRRRGETKDGPRRWSRLPRFVANRLRMYAAEYRRLDPARRREFVRAKLSVLAGIAAQRDLFRGDPSELRRIAVYEANIAAGRRYIPARYDGPVILVLTDGRAIPGPRNYRLDWLDLVPQSAPPRIVPGRDTGDMLVPPNVATLAQRVNEWLDEVHSRV